MGFTPSASWAQALNECVAEDAKLPQHQRLVDGAPPPAGLPLWASIEDDFWVLEEEAEELGNKAVHGRKWLRA
eukprot:4279262-Lingulodinium_polyedra.AAC.1